MYAHMHLRARDIGVGALAFAHACVPAFALVRNVSGTTNVVEERARYRAGKRNRKYLSK